jgi:hypothetical protein
MFVYILITAELAILYTVFWYLYLRSPKQSRRIVGTTWGSYNAADTTGGVDVSGYSLSNGASCAHCYLQGAQHDHNLTAVKPFMLPVHDEMVLDLKTNHYVPSSRKRRTVLAALIQQLDDCFSEFNVRP